MFEIKEYYDNIAARFGTIGAKLEISKLPTDFCNAETIGIVMDEREGEHEFKDYGKFIKIFETGNISKKSREFIIDYLEDDSSPAFIFKRVQERYPKNFHKVMLEATFWEDRRLYPIDDFEKLMDIFKPGWREIYPAIMPHESTFYKILLQTWPKRTVLLSER